MKICKNVLVNERRTSMRLDKETCIALSDICLREKVSLSMLCSLIDNCRGEASLSSSVRLFVLIYYKKMLTALEKKAGIEPKENISPRITTVLSSIQK